MPQLNIDKVIAAAAARPLTVTAPVFYFLRHGQTPRNAARIFQGYDEPLSDLGRQQAASAAAALKGEPIKSLVVSDAARTLETAEPVAAALGLKGIPRRGLRERHFGDLMGTSAVTIDWDCAPGGGETLTQFVERTCAALQAALGPQGVPGGGDGVGDGHDEPVLIVAHGGNLLVLVAALGVKVDMTKFSNALPLKFIRSGAGWDVTSLLSPEGPAHLS